MIPVLLSLVFCDWLPNVAGLGLLCLPERKGPSEGDVSKGRLRGPEQTLATL